MENSLKNVPSNVYTSLIVNNQDPIFILDHFGNIVSANWAIMNVFGYSTSEMKGRNYREILPSIVELEKDCNVLDGAYCSFKIATCDKSGRTIHLEVKTIPIEEHGKLVNVLMITKDVTELVETKATLQETSEKLRTLYSSIVDAIDVVDLNGNIIQVNKAFEEMFGWKAEEVIGKPMSDFLVERHDMILHEQERLSNDHFIKGMELNCSKKDGTLIPVSITISSLYDEEGNLVGYSGISQDISERERMEKNLIESKNKYKELLNASPEPSFVLSEGIIRYINKAAVKTFGYHEPTELLGMHVLNLIPFDSMKFIADMIQRSELKLPIPEQTVEQKMLGKDGSSFITESIFLGIEYENKPAVHVIFRDITEKKVIEEALRNSEEKYRLITEHMTDLVTVVNEEGIITYASHSTYPALGFSPEDYLGKPVSYKIHPEDYPIVQKQARELFISKQNCDLEFRYRHRTKEWIWVESKGTYYEEKGKGYLLIVSREIEERRSLREKLKSMAFHDELTGLSNRRLFHEKMSEVLEEAKLNNSKCALLYMDIDKFKWVNDHLGHSIGDVLLKQFANRVSGVLRKDDIFARQGGDEFLVLLPHIESDKNAIATAERIVTSLRENWEIGEHEFNTTSSIGIAVFPKDGDSMDELLANADSALYEAKENGRNNYRVYS
ncbi:PAS domain S-box protein [Sporosarcina thermotolerans]|uniref:PAS domain S-box protein n=1 Tax=Sporosarcina thermotolerans TaxID=633404 RepID=A0AAW9ADL6_9BACL|nr:PAS domain S-box protein [Sporosarcina thermotolerans]MDW0117228.1 PAS domain S-box protein [Sporosarcina thermotolerans]WHT47400.1 PAS domain S-box protein [Sporosarcina thermotolerans]